MSDNQKATSILIDGSHGEGGGQIIRNSVTLACLLRKKIDVINIRANRPNPGLASQHLESIKALLRISGATTSVEPKKNDKQFDLNGTIIPPLLKSSGVETTIDLVTAGSCTLCIQCILPYLMHLKSQSRITIIGGTHVMKSLSFDYFDRVFLPTFNRLLGNNVKSWLNRPGYFPRGGGSINLEVNPNFGKFRPFQIIDKGALQRIDAIINIPTKMQNHTHEFKSLISEDTRNIEVRTVNFASIEYILQFENSYAGFSHLVEGRNPQSSELFDAIKKVQGEIREFIKSPAAVDGYMQDQLIIYMALAKLIDPTQISRIRTITPSDHTTSAIHVSQLFIPYPISTFKVEKLVGGAFDISL